MKTSMPSESVMFDLFCFGRSAGLSAMLLRRFSLRWWRCRLTLSFFHSARILRSTKGRRSMLLLFLLRPSTIKMRCRDLPNDPTQTCQCISCLVEFENPIISLEVFS